MLVGLSFLSSCTQISYNHCPAYPIAGKEVASELEGIPFDDYEHFWEWLGRINKLRKELELCSVH